MYHAHTEIFVSVLKKKTLSNSSLKYVLEVTADKHKLYTKKLFLARIFTKQKNIYIFYLLLTITCRLELIIDVFKQYKLSKIFFFLHFL